MTTTDPAPAHDRTPEQEPARAARGAAGAPGHEPAGAGPVPPSGPGPGSTRTEAPGRGTADSPRARTAGAEPPPGAPDRPAGALRELAAAPALLSLLGWSLIGRLHLSATVVALLVVAADTTGSYATAGLVTGALVLGQGITGPLRGRTVDRRPAARILVWTSLVYGAGLAALSAVPPSAGWRPLAAAAFLVGLACPPSTQVARCKVAQLADGPLRRRAYHLQATVNELVLVTGPGAAAIAITALGARQAVAVCGVLAVLGGLGLARAVRRAGVDEPAATRAGTAPGAGGRGTLLRNPAAVLAIAATTVLIAGFAVVDFVLISWAHSRGTPGLGGLLTGVWAVSSAAGGLYATLRLTGRAVLWRHLVLVTAGVALLVPALHPGLRAAGGGTFWAVAAALALGGTVIPPALAALYDAVAEHAGDERRAEAFGWIAATTTAASAVAAPLAGIVLDRYGAASAALVGTAACAAATLLMALPAARAAPPAPGAPAG
jgi:MFS family permease